MNKHISIRRDIRPGDTDAVIRLHQTLYGREFGFDDSFLNHIAGLLMGGRDVVDEKYELHFTRAGDSP